MKSASRIMVAMGLLAWFSSEITPARAANENTAAPAEKGQARYEDKDQGCSYVVPEGVKKKESRTGKTTFSGPKGSPMVTVYAEEYPGTLQEYADAYVASLKKNYPNLKVVSVGPFTSDKGASGLKIHVTNTLEKFELVEQVYCLDGVKGKKLAVACTALASEAPKFQAAFEACGKSLALLP